MNYLQHSLFKPTPKYIKFNKESVTIVEGANTLAQMSLSGWQVPFEQYFQSTIFLREDAFNQEINYGGLGTQITFLLIKVSYEPSVKTLIKNPEVPYLQYVLGTNPEEIRTFNTMLLLTGSQEKKLPKIFLSNPNKKFKAKVEIIAATTEIHSDELPVLVPVSDNTFTIQDLSYQNVVSDDSGYAIIIQRNPETPLCNIALDRIANIELSGRYMIIDDTALGKITLAFLTEFDCLQVYSAINWTMKDIGVNKLNLGWLPDTTAPEITYAPTFTTDISILDYSVNGTNGSDGYLITKQDLLELLIDSVEDERDGEVYVDSSNITLTRVNQNIKRESISEIGKYNFIIDVKDSAGNKTTDIFVLNVNDDAAPKIILTDFGYEELYLNSTAGTSGIVNQMDIYVDDFTAKTITKQELISLLVDKVTDTADGDFVLNTNNVVITITNTDSNVIVNSITQAGVYDIYIQVVDSNGNVGNSLWRDENTPLLDIAAAPFNHLLFNVKSNQAPDVIFYLPEPLNLYVFGNKITKTNLKTVLIESVVDDRDGIITDSILNIGIFKTYDQTTAGAGTVGYEDDLGNITEFIEVLETYEVLYIDEAGIYNMIVTVVDSDGAIKVEEVEIIAVP